jgi:hypothetical protein
LTVATATGLVPTVDVAHEAAYRRIGSRTDAADLRVTIGAPLRLALLVGRDPANVVAARAAALAASADIVLTLSTEWRRSFVDCATALRDARPDAVLVVAEQRDFAGLLDLIEALRAACATQPRPPAVLVASDERSRPRIAASATPLQVEAIPGPISAPARDAIVSRLRGMRRDGGNVVLRDEAVESAARALAAATSRSTLIVDVSGASTSLALAQPDGPVTAVHSHMGVGLGADRVVARGGLDRVRRWIPRAIDAPALLDRVYNRARWPDAVASSPLTLAIEMALAREAIAQLVRDAERAGIDVAALRAAAAIVATGSLASLPRPSQTVLAVIDALAPTGTQIIAREQDDALVGAGAIASRATADVAATTRELALVATLWPRRPTSVDVIDEHGTISERVSRGGFVLVPTTGNVELRTSGSSGRSTAKSLDVGVVIDARGRPLEIPPHDAERLPTLARWHSALATLPIDGTPS